MREENRVILIYNKPGKMSPMTFRRAVWTLGFAREIGKSLSFLDSGRATNSLELTVKKTPKILKVSKISAATSCVEINRG